jgi:hypothetical protein
LIPPSISDALGKVVIPDNVADLQVFVVDDIVKLDGAQRHLVVVFLQLATYSLMRLGQKRHRRAPATRAFLAA